MNDIKLHKTITIEAGKRSDRPCIRGLRITTYDIIGWLRSGMTAEQIVSDYPEINKRDIKSCIDFMEEFNANRTTIATLQIA
jgi:uncharacterized protein (DUF433 family)